MLRALLVLILSPLPIIAADSKRPMTVADILALRNVSDVQLSHDGSQTVYVISEADPGEAGYNSDLWLMPSKGGKPMRLTRGPRRDDTPRWAPDGQSLAFLSDRAGKTQVWRIPIGGGEARNLTDLPQGVRAFEWCPEGKRLAVLALDPETDDEKRRRQEKDDVLLVDQNHKLGRLHVVDVATGKARPLDTGKVHVIDLDWSPDGKQIAYTHQPTPSTDDSRLTDVSAVEVETGKVTALVERPGPDFEPRWAPDGRWIAFLTGNGQESRLENIELALVPAGGGPPRRLTPDFDEHVAPYTSSGFEWSADGKTIYFPAERKTSRLLFACDVDTARVRAVTAGPLIVHRLSIARQGNEIALIGEETASAADVYLLSGADARPRRLTDTNPQLAELSLATMEVVRWKARDGLEIEGVLVKPLGYKDGQRYPLLTYVHGGPALNFRLALTPYGTTPQTQRYPLQVLAAEGYAILCPNPRGSNGYGRKFRQANREDWGGADLQDVLAGVDEMVARGLADPERLGMMGWSYGGFLTSWAITQTDRFKAASVGAGVTHPTSLFGLTDIPSFMVDYFGGTPWEAPKSFFRCSAVQHAGKVKTPTLIQHGEKDERVPLAQGQEFHAALKFRKVPVEFAVYPRSGHHVLEPRLQTDVMQRNVDWFKRWLKPR